MKNPDSLVEFDKSVKKKFNVYNSLFLNLPFRNVSSIGILIPIMHNTCKEGLESGKDPLEIPFQLGRCNKSIQCPERRCTDK